MRLTMDRREPDPHGWTPFFSPDVTVEWGTLDVGDLTLSALPEGGTIERKAVADLYGCLGGSRLRFERELQRSRYCGAFCVVVEGSVDDLLRYARARGGGMNENSIIGSLAAWQRRYGPFFFAGSVRLAAEFAERFLRGQVREVERAAKALARADRPQTLATASTRPAGSTPAPRRSRALATPPRSAEAAAAFTRSHP